MSMQVAPQVVIDQAFLESMVEKLSDNARAVLASFPSLEDKLDIVGKVHQWNQRHITGKHGGAYDLSSRVVHICGLKKEALKRQGQPGPVAAAVPFQQAVDAARAARLQELTQEVTAVIGQAKFNELTQLLLALNPRS
jgi:hypothetical protein